MTTIENIDTIETAGQSVTATICENAALYGATPERDEFDTREVWDHDSATGAVIEAFRIIAEGEERQRRAEAEAREFARLQSAAYNARSDEEAKAANKALDDYVERHAKKRETTGEQESRTRKESQGRSMSM